MPFKVTTVKKSQIEGFEVPKSVRSEPQVIETPERSRFKGELSARPFELGTSALRTVDGDKTIEDKSPFGVTTVKKGTIESFKIPVPLQLEPETKQDEKRAVVSKSVFEWGRPLLGGSSDEEDYGEEEREDETGEDSGRQPVYLEKDPSEVSILLQRSERKIVKPEEVIEEYVDEEGRQVKRISKVTTTKTITRSERRLPVQKMDVDVPSEPGEDVEEYTDEYGQRVRRVVRTSFATIPKTVLRDGAVKVVLKPGDPGQRELREGPEETERIHTFTSDDGRRTQKLTKTTLATQLKRTVQPVTVQLPSPASLPIHDDNQQPMDQNENVNLARVERNVSYPEWLETVKEKPPTPEEISLSSIQVEPLQPVLPTVHVPERPYIVEELSATIVERGRPVISLQNVEDDQESPEIRDRKRMEPPEGLSGISEIPRKRAHKEPSPPPPMERDTDPKEEIDDEQGEDEPSEDDEADKFNEEIVVLEVKRRPRVPKWFVVVPDEPEEPLKADGLDYPKSITSSVSQVKERSEIKEDVSCINIQRNVTIPVLSSSFDGESPMEVDAVKDDPYQPVKNEARQIEPVEVTFPVAPSEDKSPDEVEEYIDENGMQVRRIVRRTITTTTIKKEDQGIEPEEVTSPLAASEDESPQDVEEYIDENGMRVRRIVKRTITTTTIKKEDQGIEPVEVTFPVAPSEDESPEDVEEYIDENGMRARRIVRRTITTTTIKKEDQGIEPVEVAFPVASEEESPEEVEEYIDENGMRVRRIVRRTITTTTIKKEDQGIEPVEVTFPVAPSEDGSPEQVEEYIDENGVRVRRIVRRTITTTTIKKEDQGIEPVEVTFPVAPSEDVSPEEVEEYIDENGVRVRRIVRRTITTATIKREDQRIQPLQVKFPVAASEDESPEEVEEYLDENGVRVRRIERRTISSRSVIRTSVDETKDGQGAKMFESATPVYLDSDDVVPSVQSREVVLPEWMEGSEPASEEPRQPSEDISFLVLPSQPIPESKGDLDREDVKEKVTSTTLSREIVIPEIDRMEDESPEEVEEYVDENGVRVRQIVRRTITTTTIKREGQRTEPVEVKFPVASSEDETPEEVEEYTDENGVRVRRIVKRIVTSATIKREGPWVGPVEVTFPVTPSEDGSPQDVEEYVDENGLRVRRIVRRTTTTRSVTRTSVDEAKDDPGAKTFESATPVYLDSDDVLPSLQTREVVLPDWMEESEPASEEPRQPSEDISFLILPSQPRAPESKEDLDREDVMERITSTTLNREMVIPEIEGMEDESPEEVEEYVDENGVGVRRIVRRTVTTTTIKREGQRTEPVEVKVPVASSEDETPEDVDEYIDENGVRVRRIVKQIVTSATIKREGPGVAPVEAKFPVTPSEDEAPEDVEEFVDENGVRVKRIVRRTITTRSVIRTSVDEAKDGPGAKTFESTAPVYLDSDDVVPAVQTREVVLPEWMEESQPASEEPRQPSEDISFLILPSQPRAPESKEDLDHEDVMERVTSTTFNREVVIPEIDGMGDDSPEEVEEYVDENGVRVRRIVRRTITTRSIKRQSERTEPVEVKFPVASSEDETPEEVEEYIDENGVRVRRIVKRITTTATIKREGPEIGPVKVKFPVTTSEDETPEEVEEYVDENGVRVRRIVRQTITTRSVIRTSVNEGPGAKVFETATPVYLESDDLVPSLQTREVAVPEWMEESEPASEEPRQPSEDTSFLILQSQPRPQNSKEDLDREDVTERVTSTILNREMVIPEIEGMEDESPEEVEEYVDENGVRVRRIVRRTITKTAVKREGQRTEPVEVKVPVAPSEDETPGEGEEYIDENGVRVRRIVNRVVASATIKRVGPVDVKFPVTTSEDETPEEVEEFVDENGVRVRRIVRRTITTRSVIRTSVDEGKDGPGAKTFESATPVYLDSDDVVPSVQTCEVVLPERMEESQPASEEPRQPSEEISFLILPSQPRDRESKEDLDREDVMERVASTTLNRETVIPEIEGMEDESPHEVEEYVDENGVRVRKIARRTITTTSIRKEGQRTEPVEIKFPVIPSGDEPEEEVEEYVDENGVRVRRIVKRTITTTTTTTIRREGHELEPMAVELPIQDRQGISPDEFVEEYVNENGVTVKRIVKRSTTTTIQRRVLSEEGVDESGMPVGIYQVTEEVAPRKKMATVEATTPETVLFSQMQALSPRRESIPYETTVVQRYLVIIETLYQYVLEHKSMIFIYSSRYMQFNFVLENFLQWMLVTLKTLSWMRPVSWKVDEIKDQLQQIKVFLSDGMCIDLHDGSQCR